MIKFTIKAKHAAQYRSEISSIGTRWLWHKREREPWRVLGRIVECGWTRDSCDNRIRSMTYIIDDAGIRK